jgi:hypothetical protein
MKPIKLTESERQNILRLHNSNILIEQSTGKTIADIQKLVGANPDNKLGPQTLAAIKAKLGQADKVVTPNVDGFTYEQLKSAGWTDELLANSKYKSLIPTTTKAPEAQKVMTTKEPSTGLTQDKSMTAGKTEITLGGEKPKADDAVDSRNV